MDFKGYRNFAFMLVSVFLLILGCATANPTRHVEFKPLIDGKFGSSSKAVALSNEPERTLIQKGYAKIGNLTVEHVLKRCAPRPQKKEDCQDIPQRTDPTSELLKEASGRGGQLVKLSSDKNPSTRTFSRRECVYWNSVPVYRYVYVPGGMAMRLVHETQCGLYQSLPVKDHVLTSEGSIWRHEPELAKTQRYGRDFITAAALGDVNKLKAYLAKGVDVNLRNMDGELALGVAAGYGRMAAVKFLLENGADINAVDKIGAPLNWAAGNGEIEMVRFLISRGADVNAENHAIADPQKGWTAIFDAATGGHVDVIQLLRQNGAKVDQRTTKGITPLMWAAYYGKNDTVETLLKAGADVKAKSDDVVLSSSIVNFTPLLMAVLSGDSATVRTLLLNGAHTWTKIIKEGGLTATDIARREVPAIDVLLGRYLLGVKGYKDRSGKTVIRPRFDVAEKFSEGLAVVGISGNGYRDKRYGYINRAGKYTVKPGFKSAGSFINGMALVQTPAGKYGWINKTGKFVISPAFTYAENFTSEGLAPVKIDGKYGYIDRKGMFVIKPQFDYAKSFVNGYAAVRIDKKFGFIDTSGRRVTEIKFDDVSNFSEGLSRVTFASKSRMSMSSGKNGYIDKTGKMIIEPVYDRAGDFSNGLAPVGTVTAVKWTWRYINKWGQIAFQKEFNQAKGFSEGLALVEVGTVFQEKWGYIDKTGGFAIEPRFEAGKDFSKGTAKVKLQGKWIFIDKNGRTAKSPADDSENFAEGLAVTSISGKNWLAQWRPRSDGDAINSAFRLAAQKGDIKVLRALLKKGAEINAKNDRGASALMLAALNGRLKTAKFLLASGADVNTTDIHGYTPLIYVAGRGSTDMLKILLDNGADINAQNDLDLTALESAELFNDYEAIKLLKAAGAK